MSSSSEDSVRISRKRRKSTKDAFLEKLHRLEAKYKRSCSREKSRRERSRSRHNKRSRRDYSDKENDERIAGKNRRASHSSREQSISTRRVKNHSEIWPDKGSGERYPRDASRSSRSYSRSSEPETAMSANGLDKEEDDQDVSVKHPDAEGKDKPVDLDESTLGLLGDDPTKDDQIGPDIHVAVAERWEKILRDGLSKDQKRDLQEKYPSIGNCRLTNAPKLNPEIKTALSALAIKKDTYQYLAQNQLGAGINAIGAALTEVLNAEKSSEQTVDVSKFIERLADAGRILSDLHHDMSKTRKSFIVPGLNPIVKHIADDSSIDKWLFGEKFSDSLKAAKVMEKSSKDLVKQGGGQRSIFGIEARGDNRRFQSSRSRQGGYSNQRQSRKLNWHRPSGMSHRVTQRKGQKSRDFRPKDNRQHKD
ncbi:hypothetical protein ACS0PU_011981 [Formica fusca]